MTDESTEAPVVKPKRQRKVAGLVKPPTQGVGVQGIEDIPVVLTPDQPLRVDWQAVGALPPFQMFVASLVPLPANRDSQQWAIEYATRTAAQRGDKPLLDEYVAWHEAKGYWPTETPFGELIEDLEKLANG